MYTQYRKEYMNNTLQVSKKFKKFENENKQKNKQKNNPQLPELFLFHFTFSFHFYISEATRLVLDIMNTTFLTFIKLLILHNYLYASSNTYCIITLILYMMTYQIIKVIFYMWQYIYIYINKKKANLLQTLLCV